MTWTIEIENVAGIRRGEATIHSGLNVVRSSNWQGKSSFLTAIETAMGTASVLTEGEERGAVELDAGDHHVRVELVRSDGTVRRRGEPLLTDDRARAAAGLYAFLDEDNEVRRAVRDGENLEDVLTRPLEFENLDERIDGLVRERDEVDAELSRAEDAGSQLSRVERRINELRGEIADLEAERAEFVDDDDDSSDHRESLSSALAAREDVEKRIERIRRSVERTREKLEASRAELDDLSVPGTADDLERQLNDAREAHEESERDAELLQSVYAPTKRLLAEDRLELITDVDRGMARDTLPCWTCGTETTREAIEANLERLSDRVTDLRSRASRYGEEVDRLEGRLEEYREAKRRRTDLESEIADLEATLEARETSLEKARDRHSTLDGRIEELSGLVASADERITEIEGDIKYTRAQLEDLREEREELESRARMRAQLREQRDAITTEIAELRTRKETLRQRTREAFDSAVRDVLDRFDTGFETARLTPDFELVVARDGRETHVGALSEGEVEVVGLVAALAGYEAFDVADDVPVMLVDGLGGLDDDNQGTLMSYLEDRADYLVFTAYPDYSGPADNTITPDGWSVVSRRRTG